ncbi:unnamed protein product [Urochloa decumbens]|uniref:Uncharacterized protein n=1 Tax=Urochloa decumbens TaxID=240449 RepID=A0ABC8VYV7_9POAL
MAYSSLVGNDSLSFFSMMSCYKRADLLSFRIVRQVRGVVVSVKERCSGMKIIPLCIVMVLLALGSLFHVSSTEPGRGLRMLRGIKATSTSGATAQTVNIDKIEFANAGSMGFVLKDYPSSSANNRHSSHPGNFR